MTDPTFYVTMAFCGLAGLAMLTAASLSGWRGWLSLKRQELSVHEQTQPNAPGHTAATRIEMADLKERLKKLEAIAAGVEL